VANLQFGSRKGYIALMRRLRGGSARRHRLAAPFALRRRLQAVRDNEDAARASGRRPLRHQAARDHAVGRLHGRGRRVLRAGVPVHRPGHRLRRAGQVEALVGAIVGGMGTLWGPVLGALVLHALAEGTRNLFGQLPGLNLVIYGTVLVLIVMFLPARPGRAGRSAWRCAGGRAPWLSRCCACKACRSPSAACARCRT
jgi:branched-chain amino acid transport system permease protein